MLATEWTYDRLTEASGQGWLFQHRIWCCGREGTAVLVEADGSATIKGADYAYFFKTPGPPQTCVSGAKLTYRDVNVYRITGSNTFNFNSWTGSGGISYKVSAVNGVLSSTRSGGSVY